MKVYVVEMVDEYDGQVDTKVRVFGTLEKAKQYKQEIIDGANHFVKDIQTDIDNGSLDSTIENEEMYFYAYDSFNFDALTITIKEMEVA